MRWLCALAVLGLLLGMTPRWESHSHSLSEHQHGHHHGSDLQSAHPDSPGHDPDEPGSGAAHGHAFVSAPSAAMQQAALPAGVGPRAALVFPPPRSSAPQASWPPPYRPPIA